MNIHTRGGTSHVRASGPPGLVRSASCTAGERNRMPATVPGWYPDPYRRAAARWWDGAWWTAWESDGRLHWVGAPPQPHHMPNVGDLKGLAFVRTVFLPEALRRRAIGEAEAAALARLSDDIAWQVGGPCVETVAAPSGPALLPGMGVRGAPVVPGPVPGPVVPGPVVSGPAAAVVPPPSRSPRRPRRPRPSRRPCPWRLPRRARHRLPRPRRPRRPRRARPRSRHPCRPRRPRPRSPRPRPLRRGGPRLARRPRGRRSARLGRRRRRAAWRPGGRGAACAWTPT